MNDLDIPALSEAEKRAILDAASQAYEKLRWEVGDSEVMRKEVVRLARDSYCAGKAALTPPIVAVITSKTNPGASSSPDQLANATPPKGRDGE